MLVGTLVCVPFGGFAQEKPKVDLSVDLTSSYVLRGQDLGGAAIQPEIRVSYKGFYVSGWGSVGFDMEDTKEIDLAVGYVNGGFSTAITDYWAAGEPGFFHYGATNTTHTIEAQLGYHFGFMEVKWFTNFAGHDGLNKRGKRAYSSYFSVEVPFRLGGMEWSALVGAVPYSTDYYNGGVDRFAVSNIELSVRKTLPITSRFSLPLFARMSWNPATEGAYFICGMTF